MRRLVLALALVVPLLDPLGFAVRGLTAGRHECQDHVCLCSRHCPRAGGEAHCRGQQAQEAGLHGVCNHDEDSVLGSVTPAVLAAGPSLPPASSREVEPSPSDRRLLSCSSRIDPPPPRLL